MKRIKKFMALLFTSALIITSTNIQVFADDVVTPYEGITYNYSEGVSRGSVRYISQVKGNKNYHSEYWGKYPADHECGTASISMALSYIGINATPYEILKKYNGSTKFDSNWGGIDPSRDYVKASGSYFDTAWKNYVEGAGQYSPPIIHITGTKSNVYYKSGHFMLVIGKNADGTYQIMDPYDSSPATSVWNATIASGKIKIKLGSKALESRKLADVRQYHFATAEPAPEPAAPTEPTPETPAPEAPAEPAPAPETPAEAATISGQTTPGSIVVGSTFTIKGDIKSSSKIVDVTASILDADGQIVVTRSENPDANAYSLKTGMDKYFEFGKLPVGKYTYMVSATNDAGPCFLISKEFSVVASDAGVPSISSISNASTGLTIKWTKVKNATGYYVYRKNSAGSFSKIATIKSASTVSYTDKAAKTSGTSYTYKVCSYKTSKGKTTSGGTSEEKSYVRVGAVGGLKLSSPSSKKLKVSYNALSKASGYQIQYSRKSNYSDSVTETLTGKSKTLSVNKAKITYYVRVRAKIEVDSTTYYGPWTSKSIKVK